MKATGGRDLTASQNLTPRKIIFATGNRHKLREVQAILHDWPIIVEQRDLKGREIQSEDLTDIATASVVWAVKKSGGPTFVEDAGLFVDALQGFPGAFTSYAYNTLGHGGLLKLLDGVTDRRAVFKSAVAYCAPRQQPICFTGEVHGAIALNPRGVHGFGFDPVFEPDAGGGKTFGELGDDAKNRYSHRALAVRHFAAWLLTHDVDHTT